MVRYDIWMVVFLLCSTLSMAEDPGNHTTNLTEPRTVEHYFNPQIATTEVDYVLPEDSFRIDVRHAMIQNPDLLGVVYFNHTSQRWVPYFNIGSGVGKSFEMLPGRGYKMIVRSAFLFKVEEVS